MIGPEFVISTIQASGGGIMVWGTFSWHTLGDLVPIKAHLNVAAHLGNMAG